MLSAFDAAVNVLSKAGSTVIDGNFTAAADFLNSTTEGEVLNADFIVNLASYLAGLTSNPNNVTSLAEVRNFTQNYALEEYPDRDTGVWDEALDTQGWNNTDPLFWDAYQQNLLNFGGEGGLLGALERDNLDAVVLPTDFASSWAAIVGAPVITVPLGFYSWNTTVAYNRRGNLVTEGPNIPYAPYPNMFQLCLLTCNRFGLSFLGAKWSESKLIGLAYAFEQRTMVRNKVQPYIVPRTEIQDVIAM
jgi:amidase